MYLLGKKNNKHGCEQLRVTLLHYILNYVET